MTNSLLIYKFQELCYLYTDVSSHKGARLIKKKCGPPFVRGVQRRCIYSKAHVPMVA